MPSQARETIYAALFNQLSTTVGASAAFRESSRRLKTTEESVNRPAFYQIETGESARKDYPGLGTKWIMKAAIWVYGSVQDESGIYSTEMNALLDALEAAIATPPGGGKQDLGLAPYVEEAYIDGEIRIFELTQGNQIIARLPISIIASGLP
jgi:hypothetical protein